MEEPSRGDSGGVSPLRSSPAMKSYDGSVYAKYVGTSYGDDYHWSIWVPKTLVANKRGPIEKWVPKSKN